MGYAPGEMVPRDGVVYGLAPDETAHVKKGERFPPTREENCHWEYLNPRDLALQATWERMQSQSTQMTVRGLKEKLSQHDQARVVVCWQDGNDQRLFAIGAVSLVQGDVVKDANGKAGFAFGQNGSENWLFIEVDPA